MKERSSIEPRPASPQKAQSKNLRSNLSIHIEILKTVKQDVNAKPSHILQRANLSHARLGRYINELLTKRLISTIEIDGNKLYCLTVAGENFLKEMIAKEQFLSIFGLSL